MSFVLDRYRRCRIYSKPKLLHFLDVCVLMVLLGSMAVPAVHYRKRYAVDDRYKAWLDHGSFWS